MHTAKQIADINFNAMVSRSGCISPKEKEFVRSVQPCAWSQCLIAPMMHLPIAGIGGGKTLLELQSTGNEGIGQFFGPAF